MSETTAPPLPALNAVLRPCPFCGAAAMLEPDPWMGESVRIACSSERCGIMPRTEYLLTRYADELCAAWNGRPAPRMQIRHGSGWLMTRVRALPRLRQRAR